MRVTLQQHLPGGLEERTPRWGAATRSESGPRLCFAEQEALDVRVPPLEIAARSKRALKRPRITRRAAQFAMRGGRPPERREGGFLARLFGMVVGAVQNQDRSKPRAWCQGVVQHGPARRHAVIVGREIRSELVSRWREMMNKYFNAIGPAPK